MKLTGVFADHETWVAAAFVIFVLLFGRKLWQSLAGMLDKRAAAVRFELAEASRLRSEAESFLADARFRREAAVADAGRLLRNAQVEADRLAAAALEEARATASRREQAALDRIAAAEKAAIAEIRLAATDVAVAAAERILRRGLAAETDAALVDRSISSIPQALTRRAA